MTARKLILATAMLSALGGCAPMTFAPGPGVDPSEFTQDRAQCDYIARHGGGGFVAVGNANYVAGASLGYAIGEAARSRADFRDCMEARGWQLVSSSPPAPAPSPAVDWQLLRYCAENPTEPDCRGPR